MTTYCDLVDAIDRDAVAIRMKYEPTGRPTMHGAAALLRAVKSYDLLADLPAAYSSFAIAEWIAAMKGGAA